MTNLPPADLELAGLMALIPDPEPPGLAEDDSDEVGGRGCGTDDKDYPRAFGRALLADAARRRAGDVQVVPGPDCALIEYRIDDRWRPMLELPGRSVLGFVAWIKIMGYLDITERRIPQQGEIRPETKGCEGLPAALVFTLPTLHGETVMIRLDARAAPGSASS